MKQIAAFIWPATRAVIGSFCVRTAGISGIRAVEFAAECYNVLWHCKQKTKLKSHGIFSIQNGKIKPEDNLLLKL